MKMQAVNCPNCNGEVQINSARDFGFCTFCGTKILFTKDAPQNAMEAFTNNRDAALQEIDRLAEHFAPVTDLYNRIDLIGRHMDALEKKKYTGFVVWGVIAAVFGVIAFGARAWLAGAVLTLVGAGLIAVRFLLAKKRDREYHEAMQQKYLLCREVTELHQSYPHCPLGIEFCRPEIIKSLYEYIRQGRAETIKEAVNLMAADARYAQMREFALETMKYAELSMTLSAISAIGNCLH